MSNTFGNLEKIFDHGSKICTGAQQTVAGLQNAVNNVQEMSRRNIMASFQPQPTQFGMLGSTESGMPSVPIKFNPYPGFWNENYGR